MAAFDNLAKWASHAKPGNWPDADMLPFGSLAPHPGWGEPRQSRLTRDEERTQFTLWSIAQSPLILGGNLTKLDEFTKSLITNRAILGLDQTGRGAHPLESLPPGLKQVRVWVTSQGTGKTQHKIVAVFNLGDAPLDLHATWIQLGLVEGRHSARSLWDDAALAGSERLSVTLPAHGSTVWRVD
jgi:hypothetical protein